MRDLLATYWGRQEVVTRRNGYRGPNCMVTWGTTQEELILLNLFNLVVDNLVCTWLSMKVEDHMVVQGVLEFNVGRCLGVFYADDYMIGG